MITKNEFVKRIDPKLYQESCQKAKLFAKETGKTGDVNKGFSSDIPHDISDDLWDLQISKFQIIDICFDLYEDMPCYAYLMYLAMEYKSFNIDERIYTLRKFIQYLSNGNPIFARPIEYSLWCDYFEDIDEVCFIWEKLLELGFNNENVIRSILEVSGPVPFNLKQSLYNKLIKDKKWHNSIFKSLLYSVYDYFGNLDKKEAIKIFNKLDLDKTSEEVIYLKNSLT